MGRNDALPLIPFAVAVGSRPHQCSRAKNWTRVIVGLGVNKGFFAQAWMPTHFSHDVSVLVRFGASGRRALGVED